MGAITAVEGAGSHLQRRPDTLRGLIRLRPIPGFPGYWASARNGLIVSTKRPQLRFLARRPHPRTGHLRVDLRDATGRKRTVQVAQLVALAWLGPRTGLTCHADGIEHHNDATNLYYGSHVDNALDRAYHAREGRGSVRCRVVDADDPSSYADEDVPEGLGMAMVDPAFGF